MRLRYPTLALLVLLGGCGGRSGSPVAAPSPTGPSSARSDVMEEHARQFDVEVPDRPAGSQQEFVAASYLTGHLQQAGYLVRLESVPVANSVRSSDVIAVPPTGGDPSVAVVVTFDTRPGKVPQGDAIGAFLETARALRVGSPDHSVEFVGLGANSTGEQLGARRLVALLQADSDHPAIIEILTRRSDESFWASGPDAAELVRIAGEGAARPSPSGGDPFAAAGLAHNVIGGDPSVVARVLLEYL